MKTPILQMTGISAAYDNKTVLENINLTVFERDFLGVIGPNGGGKTTHQGDAGFAESHCRQGDFLSGRKEVRNQHGLPASV